MRSAWRGPRGPASRSGEPAPGRGVPAPPLARAEPECAHRPHPEFGVHHRPLGRGPRSRRGAGSSGLRQAAGLTARTPRGPVYTRDRAAPAPPPAPGPAPGPAPAPVLAPGSAPPGPAPPGVPHADGVPDADRPRRRESGALG